MTIKLSESQLVILSTACQREDRNVYPITAKLTGGALSKVLTSLLAKGLIEEIPAKRDEQVWRSNADEVRFTLRATPAACETIGIERDAQATSAAEQEPRHSSQRPRTRRENAAASGSNNQPRSAREKPIRSREPAAMARQRDDAGAASIRTGTKQALLIDMLRRPEGTTIDEIVAATGWQKHTIRGAMAGALKKKLGLTIASEKVEGRDRVYRIV